MGYAADHWEELSGHHDADSRSRHEVLIYGSKDSPPYIQLENELKKQNISFQDRDLAQGDNAGELVQKRARIGKTGKYRGPVAEIDGVLVENAKIQDITRRLH